MRHCQSRTRTWWAIATVVLFIAVPFPTAGQQPRPTAPSPVHAKPVTRLLIRNAMVVYGNAKPAFGPVDILVQDGLIARVGRMPAGDPPPDAVIDATGKYVLPGLINSHMHLQDERGGVPQPLQYEMNLYLASGVTTVRDVGSDWSKSKQWRADSNAHTLIAPRMYIYSRIWTSKGMTPAQIREGVRYAKAEGVDGLKMTGMDRDQVEAVLDEARKAGLKTAVHIAVEETNAKDFAELGVTSIEHFYGVADAALDGIQDFPPDHNANNEIDRFGRAGELYIQKNLNRGKLSAVLDLMIKDNVAWCPTFSIYEASRDLVRARICRGTGSTSTRQWRSTSGPIWPITARTSSGGRTRRKSAGRRATRSGWMPCGSSRTAAAWSLRETTRGSSIRCTDSASSVSWNCSKRPGSTPSKSSATRRQMVRSFSGSRTGWGACARATSPTSSSSTATRSGTCTC
jgi:hypothetical protein